MGNFTRLGDSFFANRFSFAIDGSRGQRGLRTGFSNGLLEDGKVVVGAVQREPVSGRNSLPTANLQGIFAVFRRFGLFLGFF